MKRENFEFIKYIKNEKDARWVDPEDIKKKTNDPFAPITKINIATEECSVAGLPIICDGSEAYVDGSDKHTMIFGSTGSKKTRLFAMPLINLFALAGESFIATDPKGELFDKTSAIVQAKGYKTIVLNFRDLNKSDYWNPLTLPHKAFHSGRTEEAVEMICDLVNALAASQRKTTKDSYFIELACSQAIANFMFFLATTTIEECNMFNFAKFFHEKSTTKGTRELCDCTAEGSVASINFNIALANELVEKTFANVTACVGVMISQFVNRKSLCQILSKNSLDISELCNEKTAIYIIVPDEKTTLHFLVTMFIKQIYEALTQEAYSLENKRLPIRLNFLLDEFCNIPTIADMPSMISAARSRNMRFFLIAQSLFQLQQKYRDDAHTIKGNCQNWVFLASREKDLLEEICSLCGQTSRGPLISTSELQRLETNEVLILHDRKHPFVTKLPDIDDYNFKTYPPNILKSHGLPQIKKYDVNQIVSDIRSGRKPILFAVEAFGEEKYSATPTMPTTPATPTMPAMPIAPTTPTMPAMPAMPTQTPKKNISGHRWIKRIKSIWVNRKMNPEIRKIAKMLKGEIEIKPSTFWGENKYDIRFPMYQYYDEVDAYISYTVVLVSEDGRYYLSDEGYTYAYLDRKFVMTEYDVLKNIVTALNQYGCRQKHDSKAFIIDCNLQDIHIKLSYFIQACSFLRNMEIFYD